MQKEHPLILYFYEKDKSISLEQIFAKHPLQSPLEESGRWDKNKRNYFIDRGGVKFFFQLDYEDLKRSWGLEVCLEDNNQIPIQINYLIISKLIPIQNPIIPDSEVNKYIKELHFITSKLIKF